MANMGQWVVISTFICSVSVADANAFLSRDLPHLDLNSGNLLDELERVLGSVQRQDMEARAGKLQEKLQPTFNALPKDSVGLLEAPAVRYLLHRYFVDRHGWYVIGFDAEGDAWNSSSPVVALGEHVGSETQEVFEAHLGTRGLQLHEVSLLAATLESFVHLETVQRLHGTYRVLGMSLSDEEHANESEVVHALNTYMLMYVLGLNHSDVSRQVLEAQWQEIETVYPSWHQTVKWIREVRKEVLSSIPEARNSIGTTVRVLEEISDRYGRWQDKECEDLKGSLLALKQSGPGRVSLSTFYEAALDGQWQFTESRGYLRQLGSLDETDQVRPSVVISNYINSPANCVAASKFYAVCCISECESLLSHVEQQLNAPEATPEKIVEVIERLPSATVEAPRKIPDALRQRLDEIAAQHSGTVPFHARLFNQWLHHAYPNECPYPQLSGMSKPVSPEKWMMASTQSVEADEESMRQHVEEAGPEADEMNEELPWSTEEELFISRPISLTSGPKSSSVVKGIGFVALACSMSLMIMRMIGASRDAVSDTLAKGKVRV